MVRLNVFVEMEVEAEATDCPAAVETLVIRLNLFVDDPIVGVEVVVEVGVELGAEVRWRSRSGSMQTLDQQKQRFRWLVSTNLWTILLPLRKMHLLIVLCRRITSMVMCVGEKKNLRKQCPCSCLMSSPAAYNAFYAIFVLYPHLMHAPFGEAISDCCRNKYVTFG